MRIIILAILSIFNWTLAADTPDSIPRAIISEPAHPWKNKIVILPPEAHNVAYDLVQGQTVILSHSLNETAQIILAQQQDIAHCQDLKCVDSTVNHSGATGVLYSFWNRKKDSVSVNFMYRIVADSTTPMQRHSLHLPYLDWIKQNHQPAVVKLLHQALQLPYSPPRPQRSKAPGFAKLYINSDPEEAYIAINGAEPICKSPCHTTVSLDSTQEVEITAAWKIEKHIWAHRIKAKLNPGDSQQVFLKLRRQHPSIVIKSEPQAQIFLADQPLDGKSRALGTTPYNLKNFDLTAHSWRIWAVGYRDTVLNFVPDPMGKNIFDLKLELQDDPVLLNAQLQVARNLRNQKVAKVLKISSIAPLILGPTFAWLAHGDIIEAQNLKKDLEQPSSGMGPNFKKLEQDHSDAVNRGKNKLIIGSALLGSGIIMLSTGFALDF